MPILNDDALELQEPFRLMVGNSQNILTIRDVDGRVRYANPSFYRVLGYSEEAVAGSTCFELLHPEDRDTVLSALGGYIQTPGARGNIR